MSLDNIFPPASPLSQTEEDVLAEIYNSPVVLKHLRGMALNDTKELLALSAITSDKERLAQAHAVVQGKLQVIATLLSIATPTPKEQ